ncbi:sugar dehydrogenase, partial [Streptomyces fulvissimus]|nr:sugar dehydrogenase [Streptomyces microflavus]
MNARTRCSALLGTLCLVASVALSTASADEPGPPARQAAVTLTEVAEAQNPTAGAAGPGDTLWIA